MSQIPYIRPGTVITCQTCNGTGRIAWCNWLCGYCNGVGTQIHMPNSTTTVITINTRGDV